MPNQISTYEPTLTFVSDPRMEHARAAPVRGLRELPDGPLHDFDAVYYKDRRRRWLVIGSGEECHIRISDRTVSEKHCVFKWDPDEPGGLLRDNRSKNGTLINARHIDKAPLYNGDLVTLGRKTLLAVGEDAEEQGILINAISLQEFLEKAQSMYRSPNKAAKHLGIPVSTLRDWMNSGRFLQETA